jgi:hypothetical protein
VGWGEAASVLSAACAIFALAFQVIKDFETWKVGKKISKRQLRNDLTKRTAVSFGFSAVSIALAIVSNEHSSLLRKVHMLGSDSFLLLSYTMYGVEVISAVYFAFSYVRLLFVDPPFKLKSAGKLTKGRGSATG